jgi:predicted negative regulator of RcsB-dependent stress response
MTSPIISNRAGSESSMESMSDWLQLHSRQVSWAVIGLVVVVGGGWFYTRSQSLKAERAVAAYSGVQQSIASGNLPLAESDLRKLITRYDGTPAAMQGSLVLAQLLYQEGKIEDGIAELQKAAPKLESSKDFGPAAHLLMAGGYEQTKKFVQAAQEYEAAAKGARFDADRQRYQSFAAEDYLIAGRKDDARRIWTTLAADSKGTVAGEARMRLGELDATPEPKG